VTVTAPPRPRTTAPHPQDRATAGTWRVVRFLLRRDRVELPAWLLGITVFVFSFNTALPTIAPTAEDLAAFSQSRRARSARC
jgi:ABC-2 type transport system permease protein